MKKLYISLFIATLVVGIFLRFYRLGGIPDSLNWDEVSWGYNAYSILKTGHDEHGAFMPLSFKAFGDYKQPVYVYLTSLSVGLFGLNPFSVRFSSAFLGVLTIPFVWLLVFELFKKEKHMVYKDMTFCEYNDCVIVNDGTKKELREKVKHFVDGLN